MSGGVWFVVGLAVGLILGRIRPGIETGSPAYWLVAAAIILVAVVVLAGRRGQ